MKNKEAIEILKHLINDLHLKSEEYVECFSMAISALEKQEGRNPFSDNDTSILPCPFCGTSVYIEKKPLWRTYRDGTTHGYVGDYKFEIECHNCGCNVPMKSTDTIFSDEKTAKENAIKAWNRRVDNV